MKIFKISQTRYNYYDTYDSAIVVAEDEDDARTIHPDDRRIPMRGLFHYSWANDPADVTVEYIGEADSKYIQAEVICSSFNAG